MFALSSDLFYFKFILRLETDTFRSHQLPIAPQVGRDLLSLSIIRARILTGLTLCRSSASSHSHCAHEYNSPVMSNNDYFATGAHHLWLLQPLLTVLCDALEPFWEGI